MNIKNKNKISNKLKCITLFILFAVVNNKIALASGLQNFKLFTGSERLLTDLTTGGLYVIPILTILSVIWFQGHKMVAEQNEQQMWTKRTKIALAAGIFALTIDGTFNFLLSYYK